RTATPDRTSAEEEGSQANQDATVTGVSLQCQLASRLSSAPPTVPTEPHATAVAHRWPSSVVARPTLMRLAASQLRISQLARPSIRLTRAVTTLPSALLYGGAITSPAPLSSGRRSPTRSFIGRILLSAADFALLGRARPCGVRRDVAGQFSCTFGTIQS